MKVILLQDVAKIGRRGSIVDVPTGHALNMLIPKGLAESATPENLKRQKARDAKAAEGQAASDEQFKAALESLTDKTVTIKVQANDQGHLFEAVKSTAIAEALRAEGVVISANHIHIAEPIKEVGAHTVTLENGDMKGELKLEITA